MTIYAKDLVSWAYTAACLGLALVFAVPAAFAGTIITAFSVCFLFWYVVACVTWWTTRDCIQRASAVLWPNATLKSSRSTARFSRGSSYMHLLDIDLIPSVPAGPGCNTTSGSASSYLKKSDSLQSIVGTGMDRDFESIGGWAPGPGDDDGLWMGRHWDTDGLSTPANYRSISPSTRRSSMSIAPQDLVRTPLRPANGDNFEAYFALPPARPRSRGTRL